MINWDLFQPRNLAVIVILVLIALVAFNHFHNPHSVAVPAAQ